MLSFALEHLLHPVEKWRRPSRLHQVEVFLLISLLFGAVSLLVYQQGGTQSAYPHLMYLPVLFAAFYFQVSGGLMAGILAGLALGPFMPLNVAAEIPQSTLNWLIRTGFFVMVGLLTGLGFQLLHAQLDWLRHRALHDSLTGLPNLMALREFLRQWQTDRINPHRPATRLLMILNALNLTEIINTLGYEKTDRFLQRLAESLQRALPQAALIARVDSGKFAAVLVYEDCEPDFDPLMAFQDLRQMDLMTDGVPIHVETSIGVAPFSDVGDDSDTLIHRAEIAAIRASAEGTGVAIYAHAQDNKRKENVRLLGELRKAIEEDQLLLHYQPKVHLATGRISGVEALIRWQHPQLGFIPPGQFIPPAERTALIKLLTHWVLETALRQLAEWQHVGLDLKMALNLSTRNLSEHDLLSRITDLLKTYRIEPKYLTLEITESALMEMTSHTVDVLTSLRDKDVNIAIDDFGTGYSSLAYLSQLPVSAVKLDRSFLARLHTNSRDRALVQTVIDLCHHLGLEVVAEGVETPNILALLTQMGCDLAQGYHIGRPVPAQEIEQKVRMGIEKIAIH